MVDGINPSSSAKIIQFPGAAGRVNQPNLQETFTDSSEAIKSLSLSKIYNPSDFQNDIREFLANPSKNGDLEKLVQLSMAEDIKLRPSPDNLKTINLETKGTDLVLNISPDHLKQGYMQVLSDLTLVAKFVDSKIETEKMTANPFDSLKVITRPERNLILTKDQLATQDLYEFGPEIKFIKLMGQDSHRPFLVGPPRLEDVDAGSYELRNNNGAFLSEIALSPNNLDTFKPVTDALTLRKPILGADGRFQISLRNLALPSDKQLYGLGGYAKPSDELDNLLRKNGGLYLHSEPLIQVSDKLVNWPLNPPYSEAIRSMLSYKPTPEKVQDFSFTNFTPLGNPVIKKLAEQDALLILEQAILPRPLEGKMLSPEFVTNNIQKAHEDGSIAKYS